MFLPTGTSLDLNNSVSLLQQQITGIKYCKRDGLDY